MSNCALRFREISKSYDSKRLVLDQLSFALNASEQILVYGKSGSGKSSLVNLAAHLDSPTTGTIELFGKAIGEYNDIAQIRCTKIGLIFQLHHLIPQLSLEQNVSLPMLPLKISKKDRIQKARNLLSQVGIESFQSLPCHISGGERQRVAVARALVNDPDLILADEPTGNLDPENSKLVLDLLQGLCEKNNASLLIATHDSEAFSRFERTLKLG